MSELLTAGRIDARRTTTGAVLHAFKLAEHAASQVAIARVHVLIAKHKAAGAADDGLLVEARHWRDEATRRGRDEQRWCRIHKERRDEAERLLGRLAQQSETGGLPA